MFLTDALCAYSRGALRLWKRRRVFRMTAHFQARKRNCYTAAIKILHRSLKRSSHGNHYKHLDNAELYQVRVQAACSQLGFEEKVTRDALDYSRIFLSKRTLADLSIWEPRSFKAIASLGWKVAAEEGLNGGKAVTDIPSGIITRGMLKK